MTVKTPIRTVFDAQNNATGLAEFQTGERVGISHGGTGLASVGTAGQVLAVNANTDGLEYVDSDTATINDRMQVANTIALANARLGATSTVTMVGDLTGSNSFSSNATSIVTTLASTGTPTGTFGSGSLVPVITVDAKGRITNISNTTVAGVSGTVWTPANNNLRISTADGSTYDTTIGSFITVANTQTLHTSITANLNSYIANTNPRIASNDTDISNLLTSVSGTNTAIRTLVSDRMQVANTIALANARLGATATVQITGDVAGGPTAFSGNTVSIAVTQQNNSVDLGTHTTGNYVATISGTSNEIEVSGSGSETAAVTIGLPDNVTLTGDLTVSGGDISLGGTGRIQGVDTVSAGTDAANKTYVDNAVAGVVDSAPAALDTLNELAAALGDDANFATTVSTNIGQKLGATATVTLTGDVTGSASFSANAVSITTTYNNDVVLGTDTSGNYVATITGGTGIYSSGATSGEGIAHTLSVDLNELATSTTNTDGDYFVVVDSADGSQHKLAKGNIAISGFNNDAGYSTTTGTVTSHTVSAGNGLTGGGTVTSSGTTTLNVGAGTGISVSADAVALATAGAGAGTYGSTDDGTKIDQITLDAYGRVTAVSTGATMDRWILEDGDGTEVVINRDNEVKFVEGGGVNINWTDTSNGTDGDPYDLTFTINTGVTAGDGLTGGGTLNATRTISHADTSSQASVNNSGRTYIQDITLDTYGHVTGIASATETVTDTNTTYTADGNYGMTLSGTAFRLENDRRRNATGEDVYSGNTHDYTFYDASVGIRWYTAGAEEMRLENDGDLHVDGDVVAFSTTVSDRRLKENILQIDNALEKVSKISGYTFDYKHNGKSGAGVIAQEIEEVLPSAVTSKVMEMQTGDAETEYKTVEYDQVIGLLVSAINELQAEIAELKKQ